MQAVEPPLIFCTSSPMLDRPTLRASGSKRLSSRYCLSEDKSRPEWSLRSLRKYSWSGGFTCDLPRKQTRGSGGCEQTFLDQPDFLELGGDDVLVEGLDRKSTRL